MSTSLLGCVSMLFALALIVAVVSAGDCQHPLFIKNGAPVRIPIMFNNALTLAAVPIAVDNSTNRVACDNIDDTTCCTAHTIDQINAIWRNYSALYSYIQDRIPLATGQTVGAAIFFALGKPERWITLQLQHPTAAASVSDAVNAAKNMNADAVPCSLGMSAYFQGLACSACDPNYAAYMNTSEPDTPLLRLQQETCDHVYAQCSGFFSNSLGPNGNVHKIIAAVIKFCSVDPEDCVYENQPIMPLLQIIQNALPNVTCSAATCKQEFCDRAFRGLDYTGAITALYNTLDTAYSVVDVIINVVKSVSAATLQQSSLNGPGYAFCSFRPNGSTDAFPAFTLGRNNVFPSASDTGSSAGPPAVIISSTAQQTQSETGFTDGIIAAIIVGVLVIIVVALAAMYAAYYFYTKQTPHAASDARINNVNAPPMTTAYVRLN